MRQGIEPATISNQDYVHYHYKLVIATLLVLQRAERCNLQRHLKLQMLEK